MLVDNSFKGVTSNDSAVINILLLTSFFLFAGSVYTLSDLSDVRIVSSKRVMTYIVVTSI